MCLGAAALVAVLSGAQVASADDTLVVTTTGCQPYLVPLGETRVQIDAIGQPGQPGGNNTESGIAGRGFVPGGSGGEGAEVSATLSVSPNTFVSASIGGISGGYGGFGTILGDEPPVNPGKGGDGGGGSLVTTGQFCTGTRLVIAGGGGGGGGAGTSDGQLQQTDVADGGAGGNSAGAGAVNGGSSNSENDGGPGGAATSSAGGAGGAEGYGTQYRIAGAGAGFYPDWDTCSDGWTGTDGNSQQGGNGGAADTYDNGSGDGCRPLIDVTDNSGGGGGGGGGYYGGGGGGGGDDYAAAGGGGGAGSSYVLGQSANPAPTSSAATITISAPPTAPTIQTAAGTCTVGVYCQIPITYTGYPLPDVQNLTGLPQGLSLHDNGDGTAAIQGTASGSSIPGDSELLSLHLQAANGVGTNATTTLPLTVTWGTLTSFSVQRNGPTDLWADLNTGQMAASAGYSTGLSRDVTSVVTWKSSHTNVATVSPTGQITPLHSGSTSISATLDGQTVADGIQVDRGPAQGLTVSPNDAVVGLGQTKQYSATATYADGETADVTDQAVWSSNDTSVATVGLFTGLATATGTTEGAQANISATLNDPNGDVSSSPVTMFVALDDPTSISVTPADPTVGPQSDTQFTATGTYPGGAHADITSLVDWSTSDPSIAVFDDGTPGLLFCEPGNPPTQITATATATDNDVQGGTTVNTFAGDPTSLTISAPNGDPSDPGDPPEVGLGTTLQLTATAHYANGDSADVTSQVAWASSDQSVATIDPATGLVTGTGTQEGAQTTVSATFTGPDNGQVTVDGTVAVTLGSPTSITVTPADPTLAPGTSQSFTATGTYPGDTTVDITHDVTWSTDDTTGKFVMSGATLAVSGGAANLTANVIATSLDGETSGSTLVTVGPGDPTGLQITSAADTSTGLHDLSVGLGETAQLAAIASFSNGPNADLTNSVVWVSYDPTIATVSQSGLVTALAASDGDIGGTTISATYTPADHPGNVVTYSMNVTVSLANPQSLTLTVPSSSMLAGQTQDLSVTANYPGGLTFSPGDAQVTWGTSDPSLLLMSSGTVQVPNSEAGGTAHVTATYNGASIGADIDVAASISISGPSSDAGTFFQSYTSSPFTASGGSGHYSWQLTGNNASDGVGLVQPNFEDESTVEIKGTALDPADSPFGMTLTATDIDNPSDSVSVQFTFTVDRAPQTLGFSPPASGATGTVVAIPTTMGASGQPVVITVDATSTPGSCSVSGFMGHQLDFGNTPGTCVLDANEPGTATYADAPQQQASVQVVKPTPTLSWQTNPPSTVTIGSGYPTGGPWFVQPFTSGDSGTPIAVTVDPATTNDSCSLGSPIGSNAYAITFNAIGTCVIDANQPESTDFAAAPQLQESFTVQAAQSIDFSSTANNPVVGGEYVPTFDVSSDGPANSGTTDLTTVDGITACTVSGSTVELVHAGTCTIEAVEAGDSEYQASQPVDQTFDVGQAAQSISAPALPSAEAAGADVAVGASGGGSGNAVTLSVDPATTNSACTVLGSQIHFSAQGTCVVDANQAGSDDYLAAPQITLQTTVDTYALTITSAPFSATAGKLAQSKVTIGVDRDGTPATFNTPVTVRLVSTTGTGVFSKSLHGTPVTSLAIPAGASAATAYFGDPTAGYSGIGVLATSGNYAFASQVETIVPSAPASAQFSHQPGAAEVGHAISPAPTVLVEDRFGNPVPGAEVTMTDSSGTLSGTLEETTDSTGTATFSHLVVATRGAETLTASTGLTGATSSSFAVAGLPQSIAVAAGRTTSAWTTAIALSAHGSHGTGAIAYHLDHATGHVSSTACSVSGAQLAATRPGVCFVYATIAADSTYAGASSTDVSVTFTAAPQTIGATAAKTTSPWNASVALSAHGYRGTGSITYHLDHTTGHASSAACSLAAAKLSATRPGVCFVYATIAADANYTAASSADVAVTFTPASQSIAVAAAKTKSPVNTSVALSAHGYHGTGAITYHLDHAAGHVSTSGCSISGAKVSGARAGVCFVYATIAADANYTAATSPDISVTFTG